MTLFDLSKGQMGKILIKSIDILEENLVLRLSQMGFIPGEVVELCTTSPLVKGSILVSVRGARIALAKSEALHIHVELIS